MSELTSNPVLIQGLILGGREELEKEQCLLGFGWAMPGALLKRGRLGFHLFPPGTDQVCHSSLRGNLGNVVSVTGKVDVTTGQEAGPAWKCECCGCNYFTYSPFTPKCPSYSTRHSRPCLRAFELAVPSYWLALLSASEWLVPSHPSGSTPTSCRWRALSWLSPPMSPPSPCLSLTLSPALPP